MVDVSITKMDGSVLELTAELHDLVKDLRQRVAELVGIAVGKVELRNVPEHDRLKDEDTLREVMGSRIGRALPLMMVARMYRGVEWINDPKEEDFIHMKLEGHSDFVFDVCFHPSKPLFASVGQEASVILWDLSTVEYFSDSTGVQKMQCSPFQSFEAGPANSVAFAESSGQDVLLIGRSDGRLEVQDVQEGLVASTTQACDSAIIWLQPLPETQQVFCGSGPSRGAISPTPGGDLAVLSMVDWSLLKKWPVPEAFSHCYHPVLRVICSGQNSHVSVWLLDGTMRGQLKVSGGHVRSLSPHPSSTRVLVGARTMISEIDLDTKEVFHTIPVDAAGWAFGGNWWSQYDPSGDYIFITEPSSSCISISARSNLDKPLHKFNGHNDYIFRFAFNRAGNRMASASGDCKIIIWDLEMETITKPRAQAADKSLICDAVFAAFLPSGDWFWLVHADGIRLVSSADFSVRCSIDMELCSASRTWELQCAISPDGQHLCLSDGRFLSWFSLTETGITRPIQNQVVHATELDHDGRITSMSISPDGTKLLATVCKNMNAVSSAAISADIQDIANLRVLQVYKEHHARLFSGAIASDSLIAATGSHSGVRVWNMSTGETLARHAHGCFAMSFVSSSLPTTIAFDHQNGDIEWYDYVKGTAFLMKGHKERVTCILPIDNGSFLLSTSEDCTLRLWDSSEAETICKFSQHQARAFTWAAVHPGGPATLVLVQEKSQRLFALRF